MSFQLMAWAVGQPCQNAGQKLVLLMLANHANGHSGQCNPSHQRLAQECCVGISTLKNHINALVDQGFLRVIHRSREGVSLPNQYQILAPDASQYLTHPVENDTGVGQNLADGGSESDRGVGQNLATETVNKKQEKNREIKQAPRSRSSGVVQKPSDVSDDVWESFKTLRKAKKAPITDVVVSGIRREAKTAGITLEAALSTCCERGWAGFRADWIAPSIDAVTNPAGVVMNRQEALEARNLEVGLRWVERMEREAAERGEL